MDDAFRRRLFQKVKSMTQAQFDLMMVHLFDNHYEVAKRHYQEAMQIELQPAQRRRVEAKVKQIKEEWDGIF